MILAFAATLAALAQEPLDGDDPARVAPASDEARIALSTFELADGLRAALFAAEPLIANPVCFFPARDGSFYVAETFRHNAGVDDVRGHMDWLDDDLAARSVADRVAFLRKWNGDAFEARYLTESERVRRVRDTDGDRVADSASVFADGFHDPASGIGAGLLERDGAVYFANIPDLWLLSDGDRDGVSDARRSLSHGYGVHIAYLGHDLHGLAIGPDGKLYFSCGDRGLRVETERGVVDNAHTGAVLRCNLDGGELEVFATGLRNPQELAFDDLGNLFTGDNNSDGGDKARIVHVVEGGDSGWRYAYQHISAPKLRGPWNDELLWMPHFAGQAAYLVPPIANAANGPSGFVHHPGTGLDARWRSRFFLCDFGGTPKHSGVLSFALEPRGASFALSGDVERAIWGLCATDVDFGPDGALYVSDWVFGWNKTGKGRIYAFASASADARELDDVRASLASDFQRKSRQELGALLRHRDRRLRLEAQLELVARGAEGFDALANAARSRDSLLARVHGIWGIGCLARRDPTVLTAIRPMLADADAEVRAQVARVLGDTQDRASEGALIGRLRDESPRVAFYAAIAVARLSSRGAREPLVELARSVAESDPTLRHAVCLALSTCASAGELEALAADPSIDVRVAAVVALRRQRSALVARFVHDADVRVATEAARAILDLDLRDALAALAGRIELATLADLPGALVRRALHANRRLGGASELAALARFAARQDVAPAWRGEALELLADWSKPGARDRFTGEWKPLEPRDASALPELVVAMQSEIDAAPPEVAIGWARLVAGQRVDACLPTIERWIADGARAPSVRAAAIETVASLAPPTAVETLKRCMLDGDGEVRAAAIVGLQRVAPGEALPILLRALQSADPRELRVAYHGLGELDQPEAEQELVSALERVDAGLVPGEVALDLVLACEKKGTPALGDRLSKRTVAREALDPELARYLDSLLGGDVERGRALFRERTELQCLKCHAVEPGGEGGVVGPALSGLSARQTRLSLLESLLAPNRKIALGFDTTTFVTHDETMIEGRVLAESAEAIRVMRSDGSIEELAPAQIASRRPGLSAMPEKLVQGLSRAEVRDLIAFLASL